MKTKEWHRVGCNKSIIPHNQPQRQVAGAWKAHLCFMLLPDSNFCVYLGPFPLGWTQSALPKPPGWHSSCARAHKLPATPELSLRCFLHVDQEEISTYSLGKFLWDGIPAASAWPQQHFWAAQDRGGGAKAFTGNLRYVEQNCFRTPWGALKQYDILSNLIQFHIFCQCFPNFVVLRIWQLFLVCPYKTGSVFKKKCAQAKSASSLPAITGTFPISFAFL